MTVPVGLCAVSECVHQQLGLGDLAHLAPIPAERTDRKWGLDHLTDAASPAVGPALDSSVRSEDINMSLFSMGASPVATEFS